MMKKTILGLVCAMVVLHAQAQTETLKVWMDDATITADGSTVTRLVISENDVVDYTSFSLSLVVPNGVTVAKVRQGREYVDDIQLTDRATTTHSISCNMQDDGKTIKIISTSSSNLDFYPDDVDGNLIDEICSIGLVADPSIANGDYNIKIVDCKFVMKENAAASVPNGDVTAKLSVVGGMNSNTINYILDENCCGTLILPFESQVPIGLEICRVMSTAGGSVVLETQNSIPANVPVIVLGIPGEYTFTGIPTQTEDSYNEGDYVGVYSNRIIAKGYILQSVEGVIGFYPVSAENPVTIPTYRCFLQSDDTFDVIPLDLSTTSIESVVKENKNSDRYYDLLGRGVKSLEKGGVYVKKGEKVLKR